MNSTWLSPDRCAGLVQAWLEQTRCDLPLSDSDLLQGVPELLNQAARWLTEELSSKQLLQHAEGYGQTRWAQGLDLVDVQRGLSRLARLAVAQLPEASARDRLLGFFEDVTSAALRQMQRQQVDALSQQRRLALDSARLGWWHYDLLSGQVHWDDRFREIFGVTNQELSYERVIACMHPDDQARVDQAVQAALAPENPVPYDIEYRVIRPDGELRWVAAKGRALVQEGRAVTFSGTLQDVTENRQAQDAIAASEAKYRSLFSSMDEGFAVLQMIWNEQGEAVDYRFSEVNPAMERHTGLVNAQGRTARELVPELEARWPETYGRVARSGETARFVMGSEEMGRVFDVCAFRLNEGDDAEVGLLFRDVTQRQKLEAELARTSEQRRLALDSAGMGWWRSNLETGNIEWDEHACGLYGFSERQLPLAQVLQRIHPADLEGRDAKLAAAISPVDPQPIEMEYRVTHPDQSVHWLHLRGRAEFQADRAVALNGTVVDVTERRAMLEQNAALLESERAARSEAERNSQLKDEFLATLSHELRTPLNSILGWTQVLRSQAPLDPDIDQGLAVIERNAKAQTKIIEDLLDMSRILSGKVRLEVQSLDLTSAVAGAVAAVQPGADAKGVHLRVAAAEPGALVTGDPDRLQQVFWNLLSNAIKFTPRGGSVEVSLQRLEPHLQVQVADSGQGIPAEFLPHVFDRFRQADASTTRQHGGLGLGMSIVKQLVELHGGSVRVESPGPGQGSTFCVLLPIKIVTPSAGEPQAVSPEQAQHAPDLSALQADFQLEGLRVLVVDDEPDARGLVQRLLQDRGVEVRSAGSVAEALQLFRQSPPDLLISDIGMPGENGYSLIRQIRLERAEAGGCVPAIALTAYARAEDRATVLEAGFQVHLTKPIETSELLARVALLAGRNQPAPGQ